MADSRSRGKKGSGAGTPAGTHARRAMLGRFLVESPGPGVCKCLVMHPAQRSQWCDRTPIEAGMRPNGRKYPNEIRQGEGELRCLPEAAAPSRCFRGRADDSFRRAVARQKIARASWSERPRDLSGALTKQNQVLTEPTGRFSRQCPTSVLVALRNWIRRTGQAANPARGERGETRGSHSGKAPASFSRSWSVTEVTPTRDVAKLAWSDTPRESACECN